MGGSLMPSSFHGSPFSALWGCKKSPFKGAGKPAPKPKKKVSMAKNNRLETWGYNKGYIEKQKQRELKRLERRRRRKEKKEYSTLDG